MEENDFSIIMKQVIDSIKTRYCSDKNNLPKNPAPLSACDPDYKQMMFKKIQNKSSPFSDVEAYYASPLVKANNTNENDYDWVLNWWRENQETFPCMSNVVRDHLAIPASTVSVERLFNTGRYILAIRRQATNRDTFRRLILLKDHYKNLE